MPSGALPGQIGTWYDPEGDRQAPVLAIFGRSADEAGLLVCEIALEASQETLDRTNMITSKRRTSIMSTAEESQSAGANLARFAQQSTVGLHVTLQFQEFHRGVNCELESARQLTSWPYLA